jgi:hypothetical protein
MIISFSASSCLIAFTSIGGREWETFAEKVIFFKEMRKKHPVEIRPEAEAAQRRLIRADWVIEL